MTKDDDEAGERNGVRVRTIVLSLLAVVVVSLTVALDDGGIPALVRCFALGEGLGLTVVDGRPFERDYFGHEYRGTVDNLVDIQVFFHGAYEKPVLFAMRDALRARRPEGDRVALDVGANVGTHSLFLSNHATTVHAIEPWPTVLERLTKMVEKNSIENIVIHPVGFAEEEGTLPFHVPPGYNLGWGSFSDTYADGHYDSDVIQLPLVVGDEYLLDKGIDRVDIVKIDIEGYEKPALKGLSEVLRRSEPVVLFELNVTNDEGFHSMREIRDVFPPGYEFYEVQAGREFVWRLPGERMLICGHERGDYELVPFDERFHEDGRNLVAMSAEVSRAMNL